MEFRRVRDRKVAGLVASGVRRFNGVHLSPSRVIARPHYVIVQSGRIAGWIGIERRSPSTCEICHLSVLPQYRRRGLAEAATKRSIWLARSSGARYAYTRIVHNNRASIGLARKLGFRRTGGGRVLVYGRST